eukprot:TRINITY_DN56025_c0_g1_i1.p2 TRINITY_DN56025_c0_g1~~TRINITY_DN56025_c0_g1_i1.p2  ORF type:complete len:270 (-),score=47.79 TRINITY_DN56025_c0_g1_i1:96-830(-)
MGEEEEAPVELTRTEYGLVPEGGEEQKFSVEFTGSARAEYLNGDIYVGAFANGHRQGPGQYKYYKKEKNGDEETAYYDTFKGYFKDDLKTGLGLMKYKKGGFYHGNFKNGKRHGNGTFKYENGDIYSGMWENGKRHGEGTYVYAKTKYTITGIWVDGQITTGKWTLTDGTKYEGRFKNQKPVGDGAWTTSKGTIVEGQYEQQVLPLPEDPGKPAPVVLAGPPETQTACIWRTACPATLVAASED